ncbi:MAG: ABC transporter ATP-binding protein [Gammaproteobacteria bacterium]|nr:ABC transporter ATP-binding protein [Gammaproteobacteria bacterium]
MYFDPRLWAFTQGVRGRIALSAVIGLLAASAGVARLALLGWLIAMVFQGAGLADLAGPIGLVAGVMVLRGILEYVRTMVAHRTAAMVQAHIRKVLYDKAVALGPAWFGQERTADVMLSVVDGVEQLETYFGQFLPQVLIALLTPIIIFCFVAFLDLPVALVLVGATLVTLIAPTIFHRLDFQASRRRAKAYGDFGAEFLDSVQGLATLKAFGQASARAKTLAERAYDLATGTMRVTATNALGRGITDAGIAIGAATALGLGAYRVADGTMSLTTLLIVLMMGVELFRPLRDLRVQLHTGMLGQSAAQAIYRLLDATPSVADSGTRNSDDLAPCIRFENVTFTYPGNDAPVFDRLDFSIAAGERIGVVGSSGSGKSSIVRLLLRFYDPQAGRITIDGTDVRELSYDALRSTFAVVNQDTYLFHGTVEDNLRLGDPTASQEALESAAQAANAHAFIARLPQGYETVVGERGIKLSGGQRQRIAIARALLRDAPILVLDEALSAVDAENEAIIQQALDRLMQGRTTLVFAHRLSSIIGADNILVLENGHIVERGKHDDLMANGGPYRELMGEQAADRGDAALSEPGGAAGSLGAAGSAETAEQAAQAGLAADRRDLDLHMAELEPTDAILRAEGLGWVGAARELLQFVTTERARLAFIFIFGVMRVLALIGVGVLSALIVAQVKNGADFDGLLWALACAAPLAGILHWLESWFAHDMAYRLLAEMRVRLFDKLEKLAPAYLLRRRTGDLAAMATQDVETVESFYAHTVAPAFVAVCVPTAVLATLLTFGWQMAAALIPFLAVVVLSPFFMRNRLDRLGSRAREALGELNAFTVDSIQGLAETIAFQQDQRRGADFVALIRRVQGLRLPFFRDLTSQAAVLEVATGLGGLAIIMTGTTLVTAGSLDSGLLPLCTILAMAAFLPVSEIAHIGRQLADTLGATRRLFAVEHETIAVTDGRGVGASSTSGGAALRLENVSYTYDGRVEPALENVSLDIPAGTTVALVGSSGAGKTTLAHLLVRFWDPQRGRVLMDSHNLTEYRLDDLRRRIALVAQDTYLFNQTLRENILIARPDASVEELEAAVRRASLDDVIGGLPMGLDTPVGERGMRLSGGQRQRVSIARAFLKDATVLILDEATSHLDAANERAVRVALDELMQDRTTVVIAHRLSTVRDADLIVVLHEGYVREQGTHADLIAQGGLYARLVASQISGAKTIERNAARSERV